jgi:hypothetical protein
VYRWARVSEVPSEHSASIIRRRDPRTAGPPKCRSVTNGRNPQIHRCENRTRQAVYVERIIEARTDGQV